MRGWWHSCSNQPAPIGLKFRNAGRTPHIFVVDDDRAVLSLVGTNVSCLEVLRALRSVSPSVKLF